jgi:hypothetical protein
MKWKLEPPRPGSISLGHLITLIIIATGLYIARYGLPH